MIALEINTRSPKQRSRRPALEIRMHFADGSKETFVQPDVEIAENILRQINPSHLFTQSRIILADDYSKNEPVVKLPADSQSYMRRLLSKGTLSVRLAGGGESFLNLANLIGYTVYPGVPEIPSDTWMAQPQLTYETRH